MQGITTGYVRGVLRLEGLAMLVLALMAYAGHGVGWKWFFIFFLLPDIAFAGYLAGSRIGAVTYNLTHSSIGPVICLLIAMISTSPLVGTAGMIWLAHIGF